MGWWSVVSRIYTIEENIVLICWKVKCGGSQSWRCVDASSTRKVQGPLDLSPSGFQTLVCLLQRMRNLYLYISMCSICILWKLSICTWGRGSTLLSLIGHVLVHQVAVVLNHVLWGTKSDQWCCHKKLLWLLPVHNIAKRYCYVYCLMYIVLQLTWKYGLAERSPCIPWLPWCWAGGGCACQ